MQHANRLKWKNPKWTDWKERDNESAVITFPLSAGCFCFSALNPSCGWCDMVQSTVFHNHFIPVICCRNICVDWFHIWGSLQFCVCVCVYTYLCMYAKFLCRVCCSVDTSRCKLLFLRSNLTKEIFFLTEEEEKYSRSSSGRAENYSVSSDSSAFALNVNLLYSLDTSGAFF